MRVVNSIILQERQCGYYKYFMEAAEDDGESRGQFCYLLSSCAKRMIDHINCPLGRNNFLEVKFFVPSLEICAEHCRASEGCRYYWWYPIENSESPLYCYLFQQCAASDQEPEAALVIGGRHPGHYFLTEEEHNDLIMRYYALYFQPRCISIFIKFFIYQDPLSLLFLYLFMLAKV